MGLAGGLLQAQDSQKKGLHKQFKLGGISLNVARVPTLDGLDGSYLGLTGSPSAWQGSVIYAVPDAVLAILLKQPEQRTGRCRQLALARFRIILH